MAILTLFVRLAWLAAEGVRVAPDSIVYLQLGQAILATGTLAEPLTDFGPLYAGSGLVFALIAFVFGDNAYQGWVLLQILAVSLAAIPLYLLSEELGGARGAVVTGLVYSLLFEAFQWEIYPLTDSFFLAGTILVAWLAHRALVRPSRSSRAGAVVFGTLLVFLRPPGIVVVAGVALGLLAIRSVKATAQTRPHAASSVAGTLLLCLVFLGALLLLGEVGRVLTDLTGSYEQGIVVDDDSDQIYSYVPRQHVAGDFVSFIARNPDHFAAIVVLRLGAFWTILLPRYSTVHNLVNAATLLPIFFVGLATMARVAYRPALRFRLLLPFCIVLSLNVFHALTQIDYDFRYRNPALPFVALFFSLGFWSTYDRARRVLGRFRTSTPAPEAPREGADA